MTSTPEIIEAVLALGTNMEPKRAHLLSAISWLHEVGEVESCSRPYETPPLGGGSRSYCNAVVKLRYEGSLSQLEALTKRYEISIGRDQECRQRGEVPIDIDVVLVNGKVLRERDYQARYFRIGFKELI